MRVLIVGAGALGKSMAAMLQASADVTICERDLQARREIGRGGLLFRESGRSKRIKVNVTDSPADFAGRGVELLVFTTKVMDLRAAMTQAVGIDAALIFLPQNGIFEFDWARRLFPHAHVCRGVTTMACQETAPSEVIVHYRGEVYVGGAGAPHIAEIFRQSGWAAKACLRPEGPVWAKLIFSAVMNPLPVATGRGYEVLSQDQEIWHLVRQAVDEGRAVAKARGVRLAFDPLRLIRRVRDGDLAGIAHRGSIAQDIVAGRPTEAEYITGALIREGRKTGIDTPALRWILAKAKDAGA